MIRSILAGALVLFMINSASAQNVTLTMAAAQPGGSTDISSKNLAEVAAANNIATIQVQVGQVLTKTVQQVAEGKTDISAGPFVLKFLLGKGLGPYSGVGKEKGAALADNLRILYPYHIASFYLIAFQSTGIDSYEKLRGKTVHNGPPRGGALILARQIIQSTTGMKDGKGYQGKQIAWGQANSIFLDRSVEATVRPGTNPASFVPIMMAAGKINIISVPKAKFESPPWKKLVNSPGRAPIVLPLSAVDTYGPNAKVISEDDKFRTVADVAGEMVNKSMDKALAKKLTAAFIKGLPNLFKKTPFARGQRFGEIDEKVFRMCKAGIKFHAGAAEAWEEAGFKIADCAK
ncbi:MAG: TAXI family TRAP transporter solute-binding subunit [Methyloligellaceae bacterium]